MNNSFGQQDFYGGRFQRCVESMRKCTGRRTYGGLKHETTDPCIKLDYRTSFVDLKDKITFIFVDLKDEKPFLCI